MKINNMLSVKKCYFVLTCWEVDAILLIGKMKVDRLSVMEVKYDDADLERLETDPAVNTRLGRDLLRAFRKCMQLIRAVPDERSLYGFQSRRFKQLQGARSHQHSLRLNDQWRLIVEIEKGNPKNVLKIIAIEDYH